MKEPITSLYLMFPICIKVSVLCPKFCTPLSCFGTALFSSSQKSLSPVRKVGSYSWWVWKWRCFSQRLSKSSVTVAAQENYIHDELLLVCIPVTMNKAEELVQKTVLMAMTLFWFIVPLAHIFIIGIVYIPTLLEKQTETNLYNCCFVDSYPVSQHGKCILTDWRANIIQNEHIRIIMNVL